MFEGSGGEEMAVGNLNGGMKIKGAVVAAVEGDEEGGVDEPREEPKAEEQGDGPAEQFGGVAGGVFEDWDHSKPKVRVGGCSER